jgi:hypothetical protein
LQCTATFFCHINDVGDGECDESDRRRGAKRATARAARAMVTAMRVVGDEEGKGSRAMVTATRVAG